jgi:pimeloyl-ACP methyl ester carboxylesterase
MARFRSYRVPRFKRGYRGGYVPGFDTSDLDKVLFIVENIPVVAAQAMQKAAVEVGIKARRELRRYPRPPSYPLKWASRRQRAWYFWYRRSQGLPIEYTRLSDPMSQRLKESWGTSEIPGGVILGNRSEYAPYVQSQEYQQPMHADTGWPTDASVIEQMTAQGDINRAIEAALGQAIRSLIGSLG